ncbi:hypothetical protein [Roseovarius rhodophyticola]|uniref:Response regulator n=1 Tax=Roseovarius rhodophyticola TaxID=3080827 RepID=A0ABZ2TFR1_9RHOB|nr:hypothetical protein [Roseovarius sp. W115]MDV2928103.1 hypothetical protein [Roseovarius sp. W115]MDV2928373.1 hypothetical protein [Roseovarius sp. W115]
MSEKEEETKERNSLGIIKELIKVSPQFAWIVLAISVIFFFREPIRDLFEGERVQKVSISVFSVELFEAKGRNDERIDLRDLNALDARAARAIDYIDGSRILWVDDSHPNGNIFERKALEELGIIIDLTTNTEEALKYLKLNEYDVVITDLKRENDDSAVCQIELFKEAGCDLLREMSVLFDGNMPRTYIYAANIKPEYGTPPFASGMTNRIDELSHYVLDSLERREIKIADVE